MAQVIAIAQQKGGSGKTTIACHVAVALIQMSKKVAVIDIDPQGSLKCWYDVREEKFGKGYTGLSFSQISGWRIKNEIARLRDKFDYIIVDTPPHTQTDAQAAIRECDLVILPVQPSPNDYWASFATIKLLEEENVPFLTIFNRANKNSKLLDEFKNKLPNISKVILGNRVAFASAMSQGKTILESQPKSEGALEIKNLVKAILSPLKKMIK